MAIETKSARPHESKLVQPLFESMLSHEQSQRVIGDNALDSDKLDAQLAEQHIERIAPRRAGRRGIRMV